MVNSWDNPVSLPNTMGWNNQSEETNFHFSNEDKTVLTLFCVLHAKLFPISSLTWPPPSLLTTKLYLCLLIIPILSPFQTTHPPHLQVTSPIPLFCIILSPSPSLHLLVFWSSPMWHFHWFPTVLIVQWHCTCIPYIPSLHSRALAISVSRGMPFVPLTGIWGVFLQEKVPFWHLEWLYSINSITNRSAVINSGRKHGLGSQQIQVSVATLPWWPWTSNLTSASLCSLITEIGTLMAILKC